MKNLKKSIEFAEQCFKGKFRTTGTPRVQHCYRVMRLLQDYRLNDEDLLVAAMLHDICEDTDIRNPEIQKIFGDRVGFIVKVLSVNKRPKTHKLKEGFKADKAHETFKEYADYKFLMYISRFYMGVLADPYIVFIKMADQIDTLTTVGLLSDEEMAQRILEIRKFFMPRYDRIYTEDILTPRYKEKYAALKKHLVKIVAEKEKLLEEVLCSDA